MSTSVVSRIKGDRAVALLIGALAGTLVVTLVLLASVWRGASDRRALDGAEADALAAVRGYAVDLTTYNYSRLDRDFAWVDDGATPAFAKQYREANKPLRSIIEKLKATAKGSVSESAATAGSTTKVKVLVFIDQQITNASNKDVKTDHSRVVMSMVKRDGKWLVDDVQLR